MPNTPVPKTTVVPVEVKRLTKEDSQAQTATPRGTGLEITWSNGVRSVIPSEVLRTHCPCATCLEKRGNITHQKPLAEKPRSSLLRVIKATANEETNLTQIWSIGNYALGLLWEDKHETGIYTFSLLQELGDAATPLPNSAINT